MKSRHERLAEIMLSFKQRLYNINLFANTLRAADGRSILPAAEAGLRLPILLNTNAYTPGVLRLLEDLGYYLPILIRGGDAATLFEGPAIRTCASRRRRDVPQWRRTRFDEDVVQRG